MRIRSELTFYIFIILTVAVGIYSFQLAQEQRRVLSDGVDQRLDVACQMLQSVLPNDFHDRIVDQHSVAKVAYRDTVDRANQLGRELGLSRIWSVMEIDDAIRITMSTSSDFDVTKGEKPVFWNWSQIRKPPHWCLRP